MIKISSVFKPKLAVDDSGNLCVITATKGNKYTIKGLFYSEYYEVPKDSVKIVDARMVKCIRGHECATPNTVISGDIYEIEEILDFGYLKIKGVPNKWWAGRFAIYENKDLKNG